MKRNSTVAESACHLFAPTMLRLDKATAERNARTLRELVKRPENKLCADCKRNGAYILEVVWIDSP